MWVLESIQLVLQKHDSIRHPITISSSFWLGMGMRMGMGVGMGVGIVDNHDVFFPFSPKIQRCRFERLELEGG